MEDYKQKGQEFWKVFKHYMLINSTQQPTYLLTRQHFGSYFAFLAAGYNTFLLKQKIIKNAISITKSKQPTIVKSASVAVAGFYFIGLSVLWHIPSLFSQLAVRTYCSVQNATTTVLFKDHLKREIFNDKRLKHILQESL